MTRDSYRHRHSEVLHIPPGRCCPPHLLEGLLFLGTCCLLHCSASAEITPPALFLLLPRGVEPYDKPNTVYVERHEPSGASTVIRSTDFFQSQENKEIILEDVEDFQLRDKYMFATKSVVSITRSPPLRVMVDALVRYHFSGLGRSRSGCKVLGLGKNGGCLGRLLRRGLAGWGWQGKGGCGSAARWFGGRLSERITIKCG